MKKVTSYKVGDVVENGLHEFGKIIEISGAFYRIAGWFKNRETAERADKSNMFLNPFGLESAMAPVEAPVEKADDEDTDEEGGEGDDSEGEDEEGDFDIETATGPELKEILKEAGLPVSGTVDELRERVRTEVEFE